MVVTAGTLPAAPITPPEEIAGESGGATATVSDTFTVSGEPTNPGAFTAIAPS